MWFYRGRQFKKADIGDNVGFVYLITNLNTGKKYIGKKLFKFTRRKKVKDRVNRKVVVKESDWMDYYGSNKLLKEEVKTGNKDDYKREILHLCASKAVCSYLEAKEQFVRDVLYDDDYYNSWISCKIHASTLRGKDDGQGNAG